MSMNASPVPSFIDGEASHLLHEFAVSHATELAREGAYDRAEALLRPAVERPDAPSSALDLQARVCAQQGRLGEAARFWQRVLDKEPNNVAAQAGLARVTAMQSQPIWLQTMRPVLVGVSILLIAALLLIWQTNRQSAANAVLQQHVEESIKSGTLSDRQRVESLLTEVSTLKTAQVRTAESLLKLDALSLKLDSWATTQGAVAAHLTEIQAEAKRLTTLQESQALTSSNQVETLSRTVEKELTSLRNGFDQRISTLQADKRALSAQYAAGAQAVSNQVVELSLAINRERTMAAEIEAGRVAADKLKADYRALTAKHEQLLAQAGALTNPPALLIQAPGVKTTIGGKCVILAFDDGLFDHGSHFKIGARSRLAAALNALAQSTEQLAIEVVGYSDGDQGFFGPPDSYSLGLKRAAAVVDFIRASTLFSPSQLRASSGGSARLPFPNATESDRSRNRTAILKISRDEK